MNGASGFHGSYDSEALNQGRNCDAKKEKEEAYQKEGEEIQTRT